MICNFHSHGINKCSSFIIKQTSGRGRKVSQLLDFVFAVSYCHLLIINLSVSAHHTAFICDYEKAKAGQKESPAAQSVKPVKANVWWFMISGHTKKTDLALKMCAAEFSRMKLFFFSCGVTCESHDKLTEILLWQQVNDGEGRCWIHQETFESIDLHWVVVCECDTWDKHE